MTGEQIRNFAEAVPFEAFRVNMALLTGFGSEESFIKPDMTITTCSAEDLVVHKAFANREQDWVSGLSRLGAVPQSRDRSHLQGTAPSFGIEGSA
jgi:hypothetical protein